VRGEHHRHASLRLHVTQEGVDRVLGDDVESDRRLVEEENLGLVQQRRHQFELHPFPE
jgi:hypothetical protein